MHKQSKRIKTVAHPAIITRDDAQTLVGEITALIIQHRQLTAEMDEELSSTRKRYETTIGNLDARIEVMTKEAREWALANSGEFGSKKSIAFTQGVIGFRTGTPKLKTLAGWTFARVLNELIGRRLKNFIRVKQDVDKEAIIAAHSATDLSNSDLKELGVKVEQDETFYVEPAVTENEPRQSVAAKGGK
jgi:phage host-nuclease inhibitor protein Gam